MALQLGNLGCNPYKWSYGLFHLLPLILTFDPNFQRDIQSLPGLREVWGSTSLESNLEAGAALGDVGPLDPSLKAVG